jgi:hypothetical protein
MFEGDSELGDPERICTRIVSLKISIRSNFYVSDFQCLNRSLRPLFSTFYFLPFTL